jgi:hypothetical protein
MGGGRARKMALSMAWNEPEFPVEREGTGVWVGLYRIGMAWGRA